MDEFVVTTRHGRLVMRRTGEGDAVLLLHGIPGSGNSWAEVTALLSEHATVLVPDLLGFGGSSRPRDLATLHASGQAEALEDALDALAIDTVTVVGHDFGGPVALVLTERRPPRVVRLGLLATNAFPDTPVPFPLSLVRRPMIGPLLVPLLFSRLSQAAMLSAGAGRPRPRLGRAAHLGDAAQVRAVRTLFAGSLRDMDRLYTPVAQRLQSWTGPAMVAWGDRDPFFPVPQGERTAAVAGTTLTLFPGAGHFLPQERPAQVAAAIGALLRTRIATPAGGREPSEDQRGEAGTQPEASLA